MWEETTSQILNKILRRLQLDVHDLRKIIASVNRALFIVVDCEHKLQPIMLIT